MQVTITRLRANYISLIRKYPKGMKERLPHFDKWVQDWKDPNITTYYGVFLNQEQGKHEQYYPDCIKSKAAVDQADFNFRPTLS